MRLARAFVFALVLAGCGSPSPSPLKAELTCAPEKVWLRYHCSVILADRKSGQPVEGASVVLTADMPSMPLVHNVAPASATPGARPGTYQAAIQFEMAGRWVITIRVTGPVADALSHDLEVGSSLSPETGRGYPANVGPAGRSREAFERRFGRLGSGQRSLAIAGVFYDLPTLMDRLGLAHQDCRTIDAMEVESERFVIRYLDAEDQRAVAYEFDANFRYVGETRVPLAEWTGEEIESLR